MMRTFLLKTVGSVLGIVFTAWIITFSVNHYVPVSNIEITIAFDQRGDAETQPLHEKQADYLINGIDREEHLQSAEEDRKTSPLAPQNRSPIFERIVGHQALKFGVDVSTAITCTEKFSHATMQIESSGNRAAFRKDTKTMSYFQFKPAAVVTAVNRTENFYSARNWGEIPTWIASLREDPTKIFALSYRQQRVLMIVNLIEQSGSDPYLAKMMDCNWGMAKILYYRFHHTKPDQPTVNRVDTLFVKAYAGKA